MSYKQPYSYPKVNRARCGPLARHYAQAPGSRLVAAGSGPNLHGLKPKQFTITDVVSRNMKDAKYGKNRLKTLIAARKVVDYNTSSSHPPNISLLQSKVHSKKPAPTSGSFQELCDIMKNYQDRGYRASKYVDDSEEFSPARPDSHKPSLSCKGIKLDPIFSEPCQTGSAVPEQQHDELYMSYSDIDIEPYNVLTNQVPPVLREDDPSTVPPLQLPTTVSTVPDDAPLTSDRCSIVNLSFPEPPTQRQHRSNPAEVKDSYLSHHISKKQKVKSTASKPSMGNGRDKAVSLKGIQSVSIPSSNSPKSKGYATANNRNLQQQSSADRRKPPQPLNIGVCHGSNDLKKRRPKGKDFPPSGHRKPLPPSNHHSSNDSICLPPIVKKKSEPEGSAVDKGGRGKARGRGYSAKPVPSNASRVIEGKQRTNAQQILERERDPISLYNHKDLQQKVAIDSRSSTAAGSSTGRYAPAGTPTIPIDSQGLLTVSSATIHAICGKSGVPSVTMIKPMMPKTQLTQNKGSLLNRPKAGKAIPYAEIMLGRNKSSLMSANNMVQSGQRARKRNF